jgi:mannan endo-1,4-beta-mannosidase
MPLRFNRVLVAFAWLGCFALLITRPLVAQTYKYEAEAGTRTGTTIASSVAGYSGTGYVTGFDGTNDAVGWNVTVPQGLYDLWLGYRSQFGEKGYDLRIGTNTSSGMFTGSTTFAREYAGQYYLDAASTPISVLRGWGYYDVDYLELQATTPRVPLPVAPTLSNPNASANAKYLMRHLAESYGQETLFSLQRDLGVTNAMFSSAYMNYVGNTMPAIIGSDLMEYSPSRYTRYDARRGETERMINWAQQTGGIVSLMWHWNAPSGLIDQPGKEWWRGFYTDSTTFNLGAALANPSGSDYQLLIRDIDVIAAELQKYKAADIPVLWRPLHEAQGNDSNAWFWWGASGPDALKQLWGLMYDRLTTHHGLNNLIWATTQQVDATNWQAWYPGDNQADIVGIDVYSSPGDNMSGRWLELLNEFDGEKLLALSETGALPTADAFERYGVAWSYFMPWALDILSGNHTAAQVQAILDDPEVISLNELQVTPWRKILSQVGDFDGDGAVDLDDLAVWRDHFGLGASSPADANHDGVVNAADFTLWRDARGGAASSTAVPEPASGLLAIVVFSGFLLKNGRFAWSCVPRSQPAGN